MSSLTILRSACAENGIPTAPVQVETLMTQPVLAKGVTLDLASAACEAETEILETLGQAISAQVDGRRAEGTRLAALFDEQLLKVEQLVADAHSCASEAVEGLRARLRTQLDALLESRTSLDPGRLEQEVALLAGKADVTEELDRLAAHVAGARELLASDEPIGRKLEFLTQEFNREANTLCSKSATEAMTRIGLDLKAVIEQIREQAANVE